jgi:hypothetical protein
MIKDKEEMARIKYFMADDKDDLCADSVLMDKNNRKYI